MLNKSWYNNEMEIKCISLTSQQNTIHHDVEQFQNFNFMYASAGGADASQPFCLAIIKICLSCCM